MLSVLCKPRASRELDLRPPRRRLRSSKCSKLMFGNKIIVIGTRFFKFFC